MLGINQILNLKFKFVEKSVEELRFKFKICRGSKGPLISNNPLGWRILQINLKNRLNIK